MNSFKEAFKQKVIQSLDNQFGKENFDEYRFGKYVEQAQNEVPVSLKQGVKNFIKNAIGHNSNKRRKLPEELYNKLNGYQERLELIYQNLDKEGKTLLVYSKVKLGRNNKAYWEALSLSKTLVSSNETIDPHFMHFVLQKFNLKKIGFDIELFFTDIAIAVDFIVEQYAYKNNENDTIVHAEKGETVLDIGGCWGDTALYFAEKIGNDGKLFSFEFIPDNIKLHKRNTGLNPHLHTRIHLIEHPVSNISDTKIYFKDNGPGSRIEMQPFAEQTGSTTTLSIDDFVARNQVEKVDFIKMDIEGAEPFALQGAIETIKKHKPKLAIAIYHSMDDFTNIPKWILDLNLGYEIYLGHYTIHAEETICFAKPKVK
jgi:FkbM family methyltransferase